MTDVRSADQLHAPYDALKEAQERAQRQLEKTLDILNDGKRTSKTLCGCPYCVLPPLRAENERLRAALQRIYDHAATDRIVLRSQIAEICEEALDGTADEKSAYPDPNLMERSIDRLRRLLWRAQQIISIREVSLETAKGQAWLRQAAQELDGTASETKALPVFNHERDCGLTNDAGTCECPQPSVLETSVIRRDEKGHAIGHPKHCRINNGMDMNCDCGAEEMAERRATLSGESSV